ncbi:hypothetical protein GZ989_005440 [Campylobacter fetus]|uniref:hypothetical protein n=1 Tax=Campylobacter fetus TaxID=196 RepID=UPI0003D81C4D|nr:hypothetical protein [Campylobacter fetus]OCS22091.1 hypothetical protein CFVI97532_05990 [Campylobacter fetus subsp. venerealis cfvi97/532]OCS40257.1 hypothetical protein CFVI02298_08595 [Campylobacter fetus subsp. venerealis cfvi02/298]AHE94358.1 hypothetical protein CFVI03293_1050 [Campylobacter fetus subsp. venerealis cfvi03/293]KAA3684605.1 hypothetical protein E3U42_09740 [Campylobacter fetus subsp. fetus]KAA3684674.1 hypothetical protein E3U40_05475 [Campylobacter fetus subsp. venere
MEKIQEMFKGVLEQTTDVLEPSENTRFISNVFIKQKSNAAKVAITLNEEPISKDFVMQYGDANIVEANLILKKGDKLGISVDNKLEESFNQTLAQKLIAIMSAGEKFIDIKNGFMLTTKPETVGSSSYVIYYIYDFNLKQVYSYKISANNSHNVYVLNSGVIFRGAPNIFFNFLTKKMGDLIGAVSNSLFCVGAHTAIYKKSETVSLAFLQNGAMKEIPLTPTLYNIPTIYNNFLLTYRDNSAKAINLTTGEAISSTSSSLYMNVLNNLVYLHNTSSFNTKVYAIDKFEQIINSKFQSADISALYEYQSAASLHYNVCNTGVLSAPTATTIIYGKDGVLTEFSKPNGFYSSAVGTTDGELFFVPKNDNKLGVYSADGQEVSELEYSFAIALNYTKVISNKDAILVLTQTKDAHFIYDKTEKTLIPIALEPVYTLIGDDENGYEIIASDGTSHYYNLGDKELSKKIRGKPEVFIKIDGVEIS